MSLESFFIHRDLVVSAPSPKFLNQNRPNNLAQLEKIRFKQRLKLEQKTQKKFNLIKIFIPEVVENVLCRLKVR